MADDRPTEPPSRARLPMFPADVRRRARRVAWIYLVVAVALLPWIGYLAESLPRRSLDAHYRLAWVGFDCLLVVAIGRTAYMGFRVDPRIQLSATAAATLLIVDAWFDVTTSSRHDLYQAIILAVFAELPAALLSLYVARRVHQRVVELATLERADRPDRGTPAAGDPA